jgi:cytosine/adenosine deaminase-related metal-dependent hydrolase
MTRAHAEGGVDAPPGAPRAVHADAIVVGDGAPVRDGAVVVDGEGIVKAVGPAADVLPKHAGAAVERVRGVVLPGLVNAHCHVELSAYRGRVAGGRGFVDWVDRFVATRSETSPDEELEGIERGVRELDAACTAAVGDVTNTLAAVGALARAGIGGCVFHEVFGVNREHVMKRVAGLKSELEQRAPGGGPWPTWDLSYAPAPHTLYTTHPDAVRALLESARQYGARTSLHLAEHAAERRAIEHGDGPAVEWIARRVRLEPEALAWPRAPLFEYAESLGALSPHVALVHLTDAREAELARVAARECPVVVCPRSNLYIEGKLPPLVAMRAAGIAPALGTDSLASNASLDVLAEARALADRFPSVPARELLAMATWNGARALGREDVGRVARGARPGLAAIEGDPGDDPCAFVLRNVKAPRRWVARRLEPEA